MTLLQYPCSAGVRISVSLVLMERKMSLCLQIVHDYKDDSGHLRPVVAYIQAQNSDVVIIVSMSYPRANQVLFVVLCQWSSPSLATEGKSCTTGFLPSPTAHVLISL